MRYKKRTTEEFIKEAKALRPEYDFSKVNYINSNINVVIGCPIHGDFLITPNHFLDKKRRGCPRCTNHYTSNTEDFIEKVKKVHPEYDYSKVKYKGCHEKVTVVCSKHGDFFMAPTELLHGQHCPKCANEHRFEKLRSNTEEFVEKAKKVFPEYDYSKVVYGDNNNVKVTIGCPKHGDFLIRPFALLRGSGCKKCADEKLSRDRLSSTEEFIEKAKNLHPEYDYSKTIYTGWNNKVRITCPKHGDFLIHPCNILNKTLLRGGCQKCGWEITSEKIGYNTEEFIERAKQVHPEYDYSKVDYKTDRKKVIIGCPKHGDFLMTPGVLLRGCGCQKCGIDSLSKKLAMPQEKFIERAKQLHPEFDYSKVEYVNSQTKVTIGCPKHGDFRIVPAAILCGEGCPVCSESRGERTIRNYLDSQHIKYSRQQKFKDLGRYSYDFYLPDNKVLIEYNGVQHYKEVPYFHRGKNGFESQLKRDQIKKDYAEKNGYKLLVIPYTEFDNIEKILQEKIK